MTLAWYSRYKFGTELRTESLDRQGWAEDNKFGDSHERNKGKETK